MEYTLELRDPGCYPKRTIVTRAELPFVLEEEARKGLYTLGLLKDANEVILEVCTRDVGGEDWHIHLGYFDSVNIIGWMSNSRG